MSRTSALDIIDSDIKSELTHGKGLSREMARAIYKVTKKLRKNLNARWGHALQKSDRNLSWLIASKIQPVLKKIILIDGYPASSYLSALHIRSKPHEVQDAESIIKQLWPLAGPKGKIALNLLYGTLILLRARFSPKPKRVRKTGDAEYCNFCYRDHIPGSDTCHVHIGVKRMHGEYHQKKYQMIKKHLIETGDVKSGWSQYAVIKLKHLGVGLWCGKEDDIEWIKKVLMATDATTNRKNPLLAKYIADLSKKIQNPIECKYWPKALAGTMVRYVAYDLALMRTPSSKVASRLNNVWSSEPISTIAKQHRVSRQILHRQVAKWGAVIETLRADGLNDDTIKFVFRLEALPAS